MRNLILILASIVLLIFNMAMVFATVERQSSSGTKGIDYESAEAALNALKANPTALFSVERGWIVVELENEKTMWVFTPESHSAHPAAIKRALVERDGGIYMETAVICKAKKRECDSLVQEFKNLDQQISMGLID